MWIYIPVEENADVSADEQPEPWVGVVESATKPKEFWRFELIRHVVLEALYDNEPFHNASSVIGLLDHQRICTLFQPLVTSTDPGSLGEGLFSRTILKGNFQALVTGFAIEDTKKKQFERISFDSPAFTIWYRAKAFKKDFDMERRQSSMEILPVIKDQFELEELGELDIAFGAEVSGSASEAAVRTASYFNFKFREKASLDQVVEVFSGLEYLFGFLIGFRGKPPIVNVWIEGKSGTLDISGWDWQETKKPEDYECIHLNGLGGADLPIVVSKFLKRQSSFVTRMHAIEFCRHFSNNINDKFTVIMPALEEYLKETYISPDEKSYIEKEHEFFAFVKTCSDPDIIQFSNKHIMVKDRKAPSLSTLLERAIECVNKAGFNFPLNLAKDIQQRRGRVFHSVPSMSGSDVYKFHDEVCAATGLLMLHTFMDLGVDISSLSSRYFAMRDLQGFFRRPKEHEAKSAS